MNFIHLNLRTITRGHKNAFPTYIKSGISMCSSKTLGYNRFLICDRSKLLYSLKQSIAKPKHYSRTRNFLIAGFAPFSLFKRKSDHTPVLSKEILSNIPKEVFKKDIFKKRLPQGFFRIFFRIWNFARLALRFIIVMCMFSPLLITYPITYTSQTANVLWLRALLWTLERAGPTYIKLGQWIGTRRDIFSAELCDIFSKLHDHTRVHSWVITKQKLRKAFGKRWRMLFEKFEQVPIGSGCIGQVHRAYMCSDMIPDESIVEEVLSLDDSDEPDIDFAEGLEIMGLNKSDDSADQKEELEMVQEREQIRKAKMTNQVKPKDSSPSEEQEVSYPNEQIEIVEQLETVDPIPVGDATLIPVAVKVLHPGIYRQVQRDLSIMRFCAGFIEWLIPSLKWLSITESVEEFASLMTRQIDLRFEADCLETFNEQFEDNPHVRFPKPIRPYCKRDVLVETLEEGEPISNFLSEDPDEAFADDTIQITRSVLKQTLADIGIDALLQMIFVNNFVHGDLHPGNILVQNAQEFVPQDDSKLMVVDMCDTVMLITKPVECPLRLVLLDVGITTSLQPGDLGNLRSVITAVVLGEDSKVAELMLKHSRYQDCQDVEGFKTEMAAVVNAFRENTITLGTVKVGELLSAVFHTCTKYRVKIESNFASVLLAIFVLEGIGRSLNPELDILDQAKTILLSKTN